MRLPRNADPVGLRHVVLIVALAETAVWLKYLWVAVADRAHMTRILQPDFAIAITVVYAVSSGPALVLALLGMRLRLALILATLPALALLDVAAALHPG